MKIQNFTDLNAWKYGHELVLEIYKVTKAFPKDEIFVLNSQMRRSALSITSNVAEGFGRKSKREAQQFFSIAIGSIAELQSQILISRDLEYLTVETYNKLQAKTVIVDKLIHGLIKSSKLLAT